MATIGTVIYTAIFGRKVGEDEFGNRYYRTRKPSDYIGRYGKERRWVIYNGRAEPSKIPPYWHGWIHYAFDEVVSKDEYEKKHQWEKSHLPNLTGTEYAYLPPGHVDKGGEREAATGDYQAWKP